MNESILTTIKKLVGLPEDYTPFDTDIIIYINSVFSILQQLGYGPEEGFSISDATTTWDEYTDASHLELVKGYMALRVGLMFDSSSKSSAVLDVIQKQIADFEWRINVAVDPR